MSYENCRIENIRRGKSKNGQGHIIYARLVDKDGELLISATLEYILETLKERLPVR